MVVEANAKSGALITAELANEQNREVYAVPGNVDRSRAAGTNSLIAKGEAKLVTDYIDILNDLNIVFDKNIDKIDSVALDNSELKVYNLLQNGPMHADELCLKLGIKIFELAPLLTMMEVKKIIKKTATSTYGLIAK